MHQHGGHAGAAQHLGRVFRVIGLRRVLHAGQGHRHGGIGKAGPAVRPKAVGDPLQPGQAAVGRRLEQRAQQLRLPVGAGRVQHGLVHTIHVAIRGAQHHVFRSRQHHRCINAGQVDFVGVALLRKRRQRDAGNDQGEQDAHGGWHFSGKQRESRTAVLNPVLHPGPQRRPNQRRRRMGMPLAGKLMTSSPPSRMGAPGSGAQAMAVITSQLAGSWPLPARSGS